MDRSDLGFAFFLALLLLAPSLPVPGFAAGSNVSVAAAGLVVWFMLAPRLPVRAVLTMPMVLALIGFSLYGLLVSLASGRLVSIAYGLQYAFYALLGGIFVPAYLLHKQRQGRELNVWRVLAWIGAVYVAGIIVSHWTGPIWTFQDAGGKQYGSLLIVRARGFAESVNVAGGIAALFAAFYLLLYPPSRFQSIVLASLSVTGLILTLSRSAILSFVLAIVALGALLAFRALFLRGRLRLRLRLIPVGLVVLVVGAGVVSYQHPMVASAWERLALDQEYRDRDVDMRLEHWSSGVERWADLSPTEQILGAGFRSVGVNRWSGRIISSHNFYLEILSDCGLIGLVIFLFIIIGSVMKTAWLIVQNPNDSLARFCWCGLLILAIHNMTEVFFYDIPTLIWLILLLTCSELAGRRAALAGGAALLPGAARDGDLKLALAGARPVSRAKPR